MKEVEEQLFGSQLSMEEVCEIYSTRLMKDNEISQCCLVGGFHFCYLHKNIHFQSCSCTRLE